MCRADRVRSLPRLITRRLAPRRSAIGRAVKSLAPLRLARRQVYRAEDLLSPCPASGVDMSRAPQRHRGGSPFHQQMTASMPDAATTPPANAHGWLTGSYITPMRAMMKMYAVSTSQPCQRTGGPQPQPYVFAGNQCLSDESTAAFTPEGGHDLIVVHCAGRAATIHRLRHRTNYLIGSHASPPHRLIALVRESRGVQLQTSLHIADSSSMICGCAQPMHSGGWRGHEARHGRVGVFREVYKAGRVPHQQAEQRHPCRHAQDLPSRPHGPQCDPSRHTHRREHDDTHDR